MHCHTTHLVLSLAALLIASTATGAADAPAQAPSPDVKPLRAGIIGLDTSHVVAFTKLFNDPAATGNLAGIKVVAGFPGGSKDIESSYTRVDKYSEDLKKLGVEIVDTIPALLQRVDVVLLESVDGRPHLEQIKPVLVAGKPVFIDKPLAGSLADGIAIAELAKQKNVPWFSSSSLRYCTDIPTMKTSPKVGGVVGCDAWSPCHLEEHHPDLYWYGIHGVELLYTIMGPGCVQVTRVTSDTAEVVVGVWADGRVGTFHGIKDGKNAGKADYGSIVFGKKAVVQSGGHDSYKGLVEQIGLFFRTHQPPVAAEETIEILAFMEAADESKRQGGAPVKLETVMAKAREEAKAKIGN